MKYAPCLAASWLAMLARPAALAQRHAHADTDQRQIAQYQLLRGYRRAP